MASLFTWVSQSVTPTTPAWDSCGSLFTMQRAGPTQAFCVRVPGKRPKNLLIFKPLITYYTPFQLATHQEEDVKRNPPREGLLVIDIHPPGCLLNDSGPVVASEALCFFSFPNLMGPLASLTSPGSCLWAGEVLATLSVMHTVRLPQAMPLAASPPIPLLLSHTGFSGKSPVDVGYKYPLLWVSAIFHGISFILWVQTSWEQIEGDPHSQLPYFYISCFSFLYQAGRILFGTRGRSFEGNTLLGPWYFLPLYCSKCSVDGVKVASGRYHQP